eukprot:3335436-Rhodomonas_salina.1
MPQSVSAGSDVFFVSEAPPPDDHSPIAMRHDGAHPPPLNNDVEDVFEPDDALSLQVSAPLCPQAREQSILLTQRMGPPGNRVVHLRRSDGA